MWPYTSPVMLMDECPSRSDTAFMWTPDSSQPVATEWRNVWTPVLVLVGQGVSVGGVTSLPPARIRPILVSACGCLRRRSSVAAQLSK